MRAVLLMAALKQLRRLRGGGYLQRTHFCSIQKGCFTWADHNYQKIITLALLFSSLLSALYKVICVPAAP